MAARKEKEPSPGEQLAAFARSLASGTLPRAVVVRGDERYFRDEAVRQFVDAGRARGLEVTRYDTRDPDFSLGTLIGDLRAPPMFAAARCIVVRNATALLKKEDGEDSPLARALLAFWKDESAEGVALAEAEGLRADHALAKHAASKGVGLALRRLWADPPPWDPDPRKSEVVAWLVARARERKIPITPDDALYAATATGNDLYALDAVLTRLAQRGKEGVRELVSWNSAGSPFDLAEHLCRGDAPKCTHGIEGLFRLGFQDKAGEREIDRGAILAITLGALRSKLRQAAAAARLLEARKSLDDVAALLELPNYAKAREEFAARMRSRPTSAWRAMLEDLTEVERRTRRGGTVDAADLLAFALRWRVTERPVAARSRVH